MTLLGNFVRMYGHQTRARVLLQKGRCYGKHGTLPESVELRQVKYLNNIVKQDHRFIRRRVKSGLGFFSFETAWNTLQGYEIMFGVAA